MAWGDHWAGKGRNGDNPWPLTIVLGADSGAIGVFMKTDIPGPDSHQELREALRALCAAFTPAYWQGVDLARGYPEEFVDALTTAGGSQP